MPGSHSGSSEGSRSSTRRSRHRGSLTPDWGPPFFDSDERENEEAQYRKSLKLDSTSAGPSMALSRGEGQSVGRKRKASSEPEDPEAKRSRNDAGPPGSEQITPKILNFKLGPVAHGYRPAPSFTFPSPADLDPIKAALFASLFTEGGRWRSYANAEYIRDEHMA